MREAAARGTPRSSTGPKLCQGLARHKIHRTFWSDRDPRQIAARYPSSSIGRRQGILGFIAMERPRSWAGVSAIQMRSFSQRRRHGGSSLVEVLVGVTVALLTVLVVYRVF